MKITLEFSSHSEMMAFCRERIAERGLGPTAPFTPTPHTHAESPTAPEPVSLGKRQHAVLEALGDGAHRETGGLAEEIGISVPALSSTLKSLAKRGLVHKVRWGVWAIAPNGAGAPAVVSEAAPKESSEEVAPPKSEPPPPEEPEVAAEPSEPTPPVGRAKAAKKPRKKSAPSPETVESSVDDILADL